MVKIALTAALLASAVGLGGCASRAETVGTAGGAVAGNVIGGGSTVGTVAGGVIGYEAGKHYDQQHHK